MQVFFRGFDSKTRSTDLQPGLTLKDFLLTVQLVTGVQTIEETRSFYYSVSGKPLSVKSEDHFEKHRHLITQDCVIIIMIRLLGGTTLSEALDTIAKQELYVELEKVPTSLRNCTICLEEDTSCLRICCTWMCKEDFARWFVEKNFKVSCTLCWKPIQAKNLFKTREYIATLQALEDEKQLLQNIDCQRCVGCEALLLNETMSARQECTRCHRIFCFFCSRVWDPVKMRDRTYSCGTECVYQTMLTFSLTTFYHRPEMKIPSQRTCPKCFKLGAYDDKCKYHTCTVCKFTFCFLCLKEKIKCESRSPYDVLCVQTPVRQEYTMFPRLLDPSLDG